MEPHPQPPPRKRGGGYDTPYKENFIMSSPEITTVIKMMESLPEDVQNRVVEHLREYLEDLQDELKWDNSFKTTQSKLIASAQRAKREIAEGLAKPMDYENL
ncbi:hypothetical protein BDGGKGIB_02208 [Nodularia sphaerocarpa UHCC 0038]|nr:hypothetical protein BDGGKGIB_02208 [Nodularia sphaerocarpa UHCC 0038]